jgi:vacuolar-type H+-ATPase subunit E/Vma4
MDALYDLFTSLGYDRLAIIIVLLGLFVDITPGIKLNPVKAIFKYLGKYFNSSIEKELIELKKEMNSKIDQIQAEQTEQREALDRIILNDQNKEIQRLRWEIIDFNNGIMNEVRHSREQYRHVLDAFEKYNSIIQEVGSSVDEYYRNVQENGKAISDHYDKHKNTKDLYF